MKSTIISLVVLLFAGAAFAETVPARWEKVNQKFSFSSHNSYYHCDYVENQAERILESMGAAEVDVNCRGGLPNWDSNWITVEYSVLKTTTEDKATTVGRVNTQDLRFRDSCDLNERLTQKFLKTFEVYNVDRRGSCWDSRGRITFDISLLGQ